MGGIAAAVEALPHRADAQRHRARIRSAGDEPLLGPLDALAESLRRRHQGRRHRPRQRRPALPRADPPRRQRLSDRADRRARRSSARVSRALSSRPAPSRVGRTIAVIGAKGGVGASTVAHNVAWAIARRRCDRHASSPISISPSAPPASTSTRIRRRASPRRCSRPTGSTPTSSTGCCRKCADHLSLLAAPATLDRIYDFGEDALRRRSSTSLRATRALRRPRHAACVDRLDRGATLIGADEIVIVAAPDLANLRNAKNLIDLLRAARARTTAAAARAQPGRHAQAPGDHAGGFRQGARLRAARGRSRSMPQLFGTAANNGQMIAEVSRKRKIAEIFRPSLAQRRDRPRRGARSAQLGLLEPAARHACGKRA